MRTALCIAFVSLFCSTLNAQEVVNFGWNREAAELSTKVFGDGTDHENRLEDLVPYTTGDDALNYRFLYQGLKEAKLLSQAELDTGRLHSLNQGNVGSCVGYATTICVDILSASNVYHRKILREIWQARANPDAIYAIGRYENRGGWDGSTGAWSVAGISKYGTLHRLAYEGFDLRSTTPQNGRQWAASGLPEALLKLAFEHRLLSYEQVKTTEEAKAACQNGYPIVICAQASYGNQRDSRGFSARTGRAWAHAMAVVAYRGPDSGQEGFLIQNSWGDNWNGGPIYPNDQPHGSFWVTPNDLKFHLDQRDSWALAGYEGFKRRSLNWKEVFSGELEEN